MTRGARPRRLQTPARNDDGSIFVESMISAAIVALALAATLRGVSESAFRDRAVEARRSALMIANSELAAVGSAIPLDAGETSGVAGALVWRVAVSPYSDGVDAQGVGRLWRVDVTVGPRTGGALARLQSLRLDGRADGP